MGGFDSASDEDEGFPLNQPASVVNLKDRAEGKRDILHKQGGRGTQDTGKTLQPTSCASKKKTSGSRLVLLLFLMF